jgi:hypothetical protein
VSPLGQPSPLDLESMLAAGSILDQMVWVEQARIDSSSASTKQACARLYQALETMLEALGDVTPPDDWAQVAAVVAAPDQADLAKASLTSMLSGDGATDRPAGPSPLERYRAMRLWAAHHRFDYLRWEVRSHVDKNGVPSADDAFAQLGSYDRVSVTTGMGSELDREALVAHLQASHGDGSRELAHRLSLARGPALAEAIAQANQGIAAYLGMGEVELGMARDDQPPLHWSELMPTCPAHPPRGYALSGHIAGLAQDWEQRTEAAMLETGTLGKACRLTPERDGGYVEPEGFDSPASFED